MSHWYVYRSLSVRLGNPTPDLKKTISNKTEIPLHKIKQAQIAKKSLDARKRRQPCWLYQIEFLCDEPLTLPLPKGTASIPHSVTDSIKPSSLVLKTGKIKKRAIVIGSGPAGLFAALALGEAGIPTTLIERGKPVETRMKDIGILRGRGILDTESNVCFGEGGAGTYTDGKLYTRVKHSFLQWIMTKLVEFGGPEEILTDAHPHLGTDKLVRIIKHIRARLLELGVDVLFHTRVDDLVVKDGRVVGLITNTGEQLEADYLVLGIGHSARETLEFLSKIGLKMSFKNFAVGVRVEHPQALINQAQYGPFADHPELGAAEYRLSHQVPDPILGKRGVYSFCMCPGGFIVPTPTEPQKMAINGMSNANRSTPFANSGIVVQVTDEDLLRNGYNNHPLMGLSFQQDLESSAFQATDSPYAAPAMRMTDFLSGNEPKSLAPTHFKPKAEPFPLSQVLPEWIHQPLREGLQVFGRKIRGYDSSESNVFGIESRTSSPVRIDRGENMQSVNMAGLYPVGEGAGYAGGIVSAALDGLKAAEAIINENRG